MDIQPSTAKQALALRKKTGLTQTEFGARLGVKMLTVRRWERTGMPPVEYHYAQMLYDDNYAAKWLGQQIALREGLWPAVQREARKVL